MNDYFYTIQNNAGNSEFLFASDGSKIRNKELKRYFDVSVVIYMECGNTKI